MGILNVFRPLLAAALLSAGQVLAGASYYFSSLGNDVSDCLSPSTPCRSLERLNALPQKAGTTYLLRRGDRFAGEIFARASGSDGAPVTFSAYGEGPPPVVDGGIPVTGWNLIGRGTEAWIYSAAAPQEISGLPFALVGDGRVLPLARFPDSGFARTASVDPQSLTLDRSPPLPKGNLQGSTLRIRADRRILSSRIITGYDPSTGRISWDDPLPALPLRGTGAILADAPQLLDSPWEWYCLPAGSAEPSGAARILLALPPGNAPDAHRFRIANAGFGLKGSGVSHLRVEGIDFEAQVSAAIYLSDCSHVEVIGCGIRNAVLTGIDFRGTGLIAGGNTIEGALLAGISARPDPDLTPLEAAETGARIFGNRIARIGLFSGLGRPGPEDDGEMGIGISAWGDGDRIEGNRIDSTACDGIRFLGRRTRVEGNLLRMTCRHLDEAGAIHAGPGRGPWGTAGSAVRGNLIVNATGSAAGLPDGASTRAHGILLDERTSGIVVDGNFISRADIGIGIRRGRGHAVTRNILYANRLAPLRETGTGTPPGPPNRHDRNLLWSVWGAGRAFLPGSDDEGREERPGMAANSACVESGGTASCDGGFGAFFPGGSPAARAAALRAFSDSTANGNADPRALGTELEALLPVQAGGAPTAPGYGKP